MQSCRKIQMCIRDSYHAQPDALAPMINWLDHYGAFWRERFDRLEDLLQRMEP